MAAKDTQFSQFTQPVLSWFDKFGRHDLPWQKNINPYRVWVSEIMLQQTQVTTVIPYFERFMLRFPEVKDLAAASQEEVLSHWAGLGYYARGRNLHKAAQIIVAEHGGEFPTNFDDVMALPGIGKSTAGAIASISLQQRFAILDGNVKRVLSRYFAIEGWPGEKAIENRLWEMADALTPDERFADYTQAIMDMGATLCTRSKPDCHACPVKQTCVAFIQGDVKKYPFSKPKKAKPTKQAWFKVEVNSNHQVELYKRAQKGIWAGLWSLPEYESLKALKACVETQATSDQSLVEWDMFRHTFSHYHLEIHPVLIQNGEKASIREVKAGDSHSSDSDFCWIDIQSVLEKKVGVPAPIYKILLGYTQQSEK